MPCALANDPRIEQYTLGQGNTAHIDPGTHADDFENDGENCLKNHRKSWWSLWHLLEKNILKMLKIFSENRGRMA